MTRAQAFPLALIVLDLAAAVVYAPPVDRSASPSSGPGEGAQGAAVHE